jgi:hypothetical protein
MAAVENIPLNLPRAASQQLHSRSSLSCSSDSDIAGVLTPSGKVGYVLVEALRPIGAEQLCYVKDAGGWHIAGFLGG